VIDQSPDAGERTRPNHALTLSASAYVQTGCGRPTSSPPCEPSELKLGIEDTMPEYTGGSEDELVSVSVRHVRGASTCSINSTVAVAIEQPRGTLVDRVQGNPATLELHADLDVGERMVAGWSLGSWCGSRRGAAAVADLEGVSATHPLRKLPYGNDGCPLLGIYSLYRD
jgi:hypothetical protein